MQGALISGGADEKVAQILRSKSDQTPASMFDALKPMAEKNIGALLIIEGETLVGILSERDDVRKIVSWGDR